MSNQRYTDLLSFLAEEGIAPSLSEKLSPLNGDASFRRYYRLALPKEDFLALVQKHEASPSLKSYSGSVIVVDAPPATQKNAEFFAINKLLKHASSLVSEIIVANIADGFFILEDLGNTLLVSAIQDEEERLAFYFKAMVELSKIALLPFNANEAHALSERRKALNSSDMYLLFDYTLQQSDYDTLAKLPLFDSDFMHMEMNICTEWLFDKTLHLELSSDDTAMLKQSFDFIANKCLEQPYVAMHRDFHCRNIMVLPDGCDNSIIAKLAIIDYQDMVKGPLGYDIASLLYDCYFKQDPEEKEMLLNLAYKTFSLSGQLDHEKVSRTDFDKQVRLCALQRHIKCLGLFNRLNLRDGKPAYLKDLPLVLEYVLDNCSYFPELTAFADFLRLHVQGKI